LAFDVPVSKEMTALAEDKGVTIFSAKIIYHLFDQFTAYLKLLEENRRAEDKEVVVFPCALRILPEYIFRVKDPFVCGVKVLAGILKINTPICIPDKENLELGRIVSIEKNRITVDEARAGDEVAIKIESRGTQPMYGRHFDHKNQLVSKMSRPAIDALKKSYANVLTDKDWLLVIKLKKVFNIL